MQTQTTGLTALRDWLRSRHAFDVVDGAVQGWLSNDLAREIAEDFGVPYADFCAELNRAIREDVA